MSARGTSALGNVTRTAVIESIDHEGQGVARLEGKVAFISGAITGETVHYRALREKPSFVVGEVTAVERESSMRVTPGCTHFGVCGGCSFQHLDPLGQVAVKQRVLEDNLARIGKVTPDSLLPPISGPAWGYRHRARLSVRYVEKKGGALVGFHEAKSSYVADIHGCEVMHPRVGRLIDPLRELITRLNGRDRMPQIEVAIGERVTALVLRHLEPVSEGDAAQLREFADQHAVQWWLQPKGPETAHPFYPLDALALDYDLPEFAVTLGFGPTEFTQVNFQINRVMVARAMRLLDPRPGEKVADLFCGLGNFTLPIARLDANVTGYEGSESLVRRATANAVANGLADRARFAAVDLYTQAEYAMKQIGTPDKLLIDPPRDGAADVCKFLPSTGCERIVYVSCSPATLARDASILVHTQGYRLVSAGIINMFPQTAHVESIALFDR